MPILGNLESWMYDVRYAVRGLRRAPAFTAAVVSAVALGIGASTAIFSVVDRILFRSLPYPHAERLVSVGMMAPIVPQEFLLGYDYLDWRERQTPFEAFASWAGVGDCDLNNTDPVRLRCAWVDSSFLPAVGIQPLLGRNFTREEDRPKRTKVALLSYGLWRIRFGGDPSVVGRTLPLDGESTTVLGVLPPEFELPSLEAADLLLPQALDEAEQRTRRTATPLSAIGRLKNGVTEAQAADALQPLFQNALQWVSPEFRKEIKLRLRSLRERQVQDARRASWVLMGAVLAVLLIACANVANLLLARAAARQRELTVRVALGAGRGSLVRQRLIESLLLGLAGGAAGCALAVLLLRLFVGMAPQGIPRLQQAALDLRVLLFTLVVSLLSGILFGLPGSVRGPNAELLAGARTLGARRGLFRHVLVATQICVSLILLAGAGLLLRTLWNLQNQPLGMSTDRVLTAAVTLGRSLYAEPARRLRFFEEWEARLRALPGVTQIALSDSLPPNHTAGMMYSGIDVEGRPRAVDPAGGMVAVRSVTPGYFAALRIPILRGRAFTEADRDPDRRVVIISDALSRRMFPAGNALAARIRPGRVGEWLTIVGVAANVKNSGLIERDDPEYYVLRQHSSQDVGRGAIAIIRCAADPQALAEAVRKQVAALDPTLPVNVDTMHSQVRKLAERPRFNALLLGIFAGMGLALAAIGLYGVISFLVAQRTREIGVRMTLGASPAAVVGLVLGYAARSAGAGAAFGVIGSLFAARGLRAMLFRVASDDAWTLAAAVGILLMIALLAAWIPARHAACIDPIEALRQE